MNKLITALSAAALAGLAAAPVAAEQAGDLTIGLGVATVQPKSNNGTLVGSTVDVGNSTRPTLTLEYFVKENLGVELLAALPFKHDITLGGAAVGSVKQLPPVVSLQYHVPTASSMTPFFGVGLNYTAYFSEKTTGALAGTTLKIKNSFGLALHAGVDFKLSDQNAVRADVRWAHIKPDVLVNGTKIGTVDISPMVYGISFVHRF